MVFLAAAAAAAAAAISTRTLAHFLTRISGTDTQRPLHFRTKMIGKTLRR